MRKPSPSTLVVLATLLVAEKTLAQATPAPWPDFAINIENAGQCPGILQSAADANTIQTWSQERLDELYACAHAGPIPDGFMQGSVIFAPGTGVDQFVQLSQGIGLPITSAAMKTFAQALWKGKQFHREDKALLNMIGPNVQALLGVPIAGQMRFPAKVYCGQSLLDGRRESVVIDYAFTDTVTIDGQTPYSDAIDWIAGGTTKTGKRGLNIRDEIRMVQPGFYLGRAYIDRIFALNFTLSGSSAAGGDVCWGGYAASK